MSNKSKAKLEEKIDSLLVPRKKIRKDGFKKYKVVNEVLDKSTMMTLYHMINSGIISYVNGVVRAGKESAVFWAVDKNGSDVALKIYLVTTSNFKNRTKYIFGDPRFSRIRKGTRNLVEIWAKKEFRNLKQCTENQIPCVRPIEVLKNVLVLEFVGNHGVPSKTLVESNVDYQDYKDAISIIVQLYQKAKLVHADFSEYNVFKTEKELRVFDLASAVDKKHPNALQFLERDIKNISRFFVRRGLTVENPSDVLKKVIK